jgi:hypothetical protein
MRCAASTPTYHLSQTLFVSQGRPPATLVLCAQQSIALPAVSCIELERQPERTLALSRSNQKAIRTRSVFRRKLASVAVTRMAPPLFPLRRPLHLPPSRHSDRKHSRRGATKDQTHQAIARRSRPSGHASACYVRPFVAFPPGNNSRFHQHFPSVYLHSCTEHGFAALSR